MLMAVIHFADSTRFFECLCAGGITHSSYNTEGETSS